jgi:hypothetical protein
MRRLIYQVAVGEVPAFYGPCMASVHDYAARVGADHIIQGDPVLRIVPKISHRSENALRLGYLPIFEKEQGFAYLHSYDQVAIIDADIYVRDSAPDLFEAAGDADFAGVPECELPLREQYEKKVRNYARDMFGNYDSAFYNMGMTVWNTSMKRLLRGQSPKEFIERAEFEPFVNGEGKYRWSTDQVLLNTWVKSTGMTRCNLDWRWNCLYDYVIPTAMRMNPHFIHFNLASKMPRGGDEIPEIIAGLA